MDAEKGVVCKMARVFRYRYHSVVEDGMILKDARDLETFNPFAPNSCLTGVFYEVDFMDQVFWFAVSETEMDPEQWTEIPRKYNRYLPKQVISAAIFLFGCIDRMLEQSTPKP